MKAYSSFALNYDDLTNDIDYVAWAEYIHNIISNNGIMPGITVDLGCGTGSFSIELAKRGYDLIGIDISTEMLTIAQDKNVNSDILFLNQDMTKFELHGPVKIITCLLDSVNHILEKKSLLNMFNQVYKYLEPNGLFIFDINTMHKFKNIYSDNVFYSIEDEISYIWQNNFNDKTNTCNFDLTFFKKDNDGKYIRSDENYSEKAYTIDEITKLLDKSKLKLLKIYDKLSFNEANEKSERVFFVVQK